MDDPQKSPVRVTISSMGNERRTINLGELDEDQIKNTLSLIDSAFQTIRTSQSLMLSGGDGLITFANLDNISFVEVHVG